MSFERVRGYFKERGLEDRLLSPEVTTGTVEEAARALGVDEGSIVKTMAFRLKDRDILVLLRGTARVDNRKFIAQFARRAKFVPADELERVTGHKMGGVCPFALPSPLEIYIDESLRGLGLCCPAAGDAFHAARLTPDELVALTGARWVDVSGG